MPLPPSPCPASDPPRRERRKQARPGELLDAALDLFVEKGYAATRVDDVASRAGVSKGTLFLYFASKEELFKAVVRETIAGHFPEWNTEFEQFQGSTADMLRHCYRMWWLRIGSTRASGITKLMLSEAGNFPEIAQFYQQEVIEPSQRLVRRILQRGVDSGEFRALDVNYAVPVVQAPMMFLMLWKHSLGGCASSSSDFNPETYMTAQVNALLYGFVAPPPLGDNA